MRFFHVILSFDLNMSNEKKCIFQLEVCIWTKAFLYKNPTYFYKKNLPFLSYVI